MLNIIIFSSIAVDLKMQGWLAYRVKVRVRVSRDGLPVGNMYTREHNTHTGNEGWMYLVA